MKNNKKENIMSKLVRRKKLVVFSVTVLIVAGYFVPRTFFPPTTGIEKAQVAKGSVREELILSGGIKAEEHAKLTFLSSGELDLINVKEGDTVEKNHILAKLDTTILYQAYLQAEADLRRYEASLAMTYDTVKGHTGDESFAQRETRTIAETNKDKAYRAYIAAQKNLANATLLAPFDGVVTSVTHPYTGINTSLAESQIEIVNPDTIYFDVSADQSEVNTISEDQKVLMVLDSFNDHEYEGVVDFVSITPKQDEIGAVYEVKVVFTSTPDVNLRIGMTGDAKFVLSEKQDVLYVPSNFIHSDTNGSFINLSKANNKTYIEVGLEGEERTEIISDKVKVGDTIYE